MTGWGTFCEHVSNKIATILKNGCAPLTYKTAAVNTNKHQ
jgi:hypothetical protein